MAAESSAAERTQSPRTARGRLRKRGPVLVLAAIAAAAFGFLGYSAFDGSVVYYRTPSEAASLTGQHVRLSGSVVAGSIASAGGQGTSFTLTDGRHSLPVAYAGAPPTALREGGQVVADGVLDTTGTFQARDLIMKCPSKFDGRTGRG